MSNIRKNRSSNKRNRSELANRLECYMLQKGFTNMSEFERIAGVKKDVVRRLLAGHMQNTSPENIAAFASALGVSVDELLGSSSSNIEISSINIAPEAVKPRWYKIKNDEMSPTFTIGDYVLVDFGINSIDGSGVYVIEIKQGSYGLRRITDRSAVNGELYISFDNKDKYEAEGAINIEKLKIVGRVIGHYISI